MPDYSDSGFNNSLLREVKLNSFEYNPVLTESLLSEMDGNKITTTLPGKIVGEGISADNITAGEMSFDRARGGTLQLGGDGNKKGIFSLRDAEDREKILMDQDGMTVTDGKITIKDKNNNSILDASGLISTTNFISNQAIKTGSQTITGTGFVDITGIALNIILKRGTKVLWGCNLTGSHADFDGVLLFKFVLDGADAGPNFLLPSTNSGTQSTVNINWIADMSAGAHYMKVQGRGNNAAPSAGGIDNTYTDSRLYYVILGS